MSFARYPAYKNVNGNWFRSIPSTWEILKGRNLFVNTRLRSQTEDAQLTASQKYGVIPQSMYIEFEDQQVMQAIGGIENFKHVDVDDFVISLRSFQGGIERAKFSGCVSPAYSVLKLSKNKSSPKFLEYLLKSVGYISELQSLTDGMRDGKSISFSQFGLTNIPFPPILEQQEIASFLDSETAKIDTLIAEQDRLIDLLKIKIDALVLDAIGKSGSVEVRLSTVVDLVQRPVVQTVGELYFPLGLFNRGRGLFHKEPRGIENMGDSDFYWIKNGDLIFSGQFAWEGAVALAYEEEEGCVVSHRYPVLRGKKDLVITEYLFALFTTTHGNFLLNECSIGAAGRNRPLNMNLLLKEKVPIPCLKTQLLIANIVKERRQLLIEISKQREFLIERRFSLISAAVTGVIDVRNFDTEPEAT